MKKILGALLLVLGMCWLLPIDIWADLIRMKNGRLIEGNFLGCTADAIQIQTAQGIIACPIQEILTITFLPTSAASSPEITPTPQATPRMAKTPTPLPKSLRIIAGTRLLARLLSQIDTIQNKPEDWFTATLDAAIVVDGLEVVPKGATLRGQVVQAERGKYGSALVITLRELLLKQQTVPIVTTSYTAWSKPSPTGDDNPLTTRRTLRLAEQTLIEFKTTEPFTLEREK